MPSLYDIHFTPAYAGQSATVRDTAGAEVTGSPVTLDASGSGQLELPGGSYTATVSNVALGLSASTTALHLNLEDSLDADAPGAAETAYFIATGPVYATDGGGGAGTLVFVADPEQGDLPAWASIVSGDIVLGEDAGTCAYSFVGTFDFDFTGASAVPDTDGTINNAFDVKIDTVEISATPPASDPGDNTNTQTLTATRGGTVFVGSTITVEAYPGADDNGTPVNDGEATPRAAMTITRLAPAPTLPA